MKLGRLNYIGAVSHTSVFASEARQSSALFGQSGLPRRCAPRKDEGSKDGEGVT